MRRSSSGAGSPDVLRISDSSPSSAESSFRELDDVFLQLVVDWFQVSKVVWKMLRTKYIEMKYSKAFVHKPSESGKGGGRYTPYSNVDSFLKICQIMGLTGVDLFSPSDVVEKRDTRKKSQGVDLSSEDSDDAERSYQTAGFQSPASDTSFDSEILSGSLTDNTPVGDSMAEDNCQTPEHIFHWDVHRQHDDVLNSGHYVAFHSVESAESSNSGGLRYAGYRCTSENLISSLKLCLDCHGSNITASCSHWRPFKCLLHSTENGCRSDCKCCGTFAASVGDSPNQLDGLSIFDLRETDEGKICNDSMLWCQSLTGHLPNQNPSASHASSSDVHEEFTNPSIVPLHLIQQSSCFTKDTDNDRPDFNFTVGENLNGGCSFILQENKPACSKIMDAPAGTCVSRVEDNFSLMLEGTKGWIDHNSASLCANNSILSNTFSRCCRQHQSGTQDLNHDNNFEGNCILPNGEPAQDSKSPRANVLTSVCKISQCGSESKFVDGNGDADAHLFNSIAGEATAIDCEVHSYEKDNLAVAGVHTFTLQNFEETDLHNCNPEVLFSKDSANALKVTDLDPSSDSRHQSQNMAEIGMLADGETSFNIENQNSDMKSEALIDAPSSFSLSLDQESSIAVSCDLSDTYSMNMPQECSTSPKTNAPKALLESIVVNCSEGTFSGEQLEYGTSSGQSNCCSNGSYTQNELYRNLIEIVSNGSNCYEVCSECLPSHDLCPSDGCKHLPVTSDDVVLNDGGNSKDTVCAFSAQEVHHEKLNNPECADLSHLTASDNEQMSNERLLHTIKTERCDLRTQPCSISENYGNKRAETPNMGGKEDICQHLLDENHILVHGPSANPEKDIAAMDMEAEVKEKNLGISNSSLGRDRRDAEPQNRSTKKILMKSVAGGMTIFGALFILLHIRKRRGEEKAGEKKAVERHRTTVPPKVLKPRQEKHPGGNGSTVYPGDRLKFKD
ncbi:hypothetical protein ACLOJK_013838 [Asimina triloba]